MDLTFLRMQSLWNLMVFLIGNSKHLTEQGSTYVEKKKASITAIEMEETLWKIVY